MSRNLFLTGTGTDIGKTYIASLITKKLHDSGRSTAYYKAAMSGNPRREDGSLIPGDAAFVKEASGIPQPLEEMCPYVYELAYSPHLASRIEGNPVDLINPPAGCPFAPRCRQCMKACLTKMPPESTIEEGHTVACWLPVKELMEKED